MFLSTYLDLKLENVRQKGEPRGGIFDAATLRFKVPVIADGGQLQSDDMRLYDPDHLQLNLS